jgi:tripartite-type tricarboxylate transporter receptor subunit TctC
MKKLLALLFLAFGIANAQQHTLKFILSTGPGSGTDTALDTYAPCIKTQNLLVLKEFKPGADGLVAIKAFQQAVDTPQLTHVLAGNFGLNMLSKFPGIDLLEDIHPLTYTNAGPVAIVAKKGKFKSINDIRELSKIRPINIGSSFLSGTYIAEQLFIDLKIPYQIIPYKNNVGAISDVIGDTIDFSSDTFMGTKALVEGEKLEIFTSTLDKSTAIKYNHSNIEKYSPKLGKMPLGIVLSTLPTTPKDKEQMIVNVIHTCNKDKEIIEKLEKIGSYPVSLSTEEVRQIVKNTTGK